MALLRELESIGQAMEKLQEQNKQLLRAIKDRDEASARVFAEVRLLPPARRVTILRLTTPLGDLLARDCALDYSVPNWCSPMRC